MKYTLHGGLVKPYEGTQAGFWTKVGYVLLGMQITLTAIVIVAYGQIL